MNLIKKIFIVLIALIGLLPLSAQSTDFSSWLYKATITFNGYGKTETLTNFPALVNIGTNIVGYLPSQSLGATTNGDDLRFTLVDGTTELNYEKELWSVSTLTNSIFWVQIPTLTNGAQIIAYWGKNTTSPVYTTNGATWDSNFKGVFHLRNGTTLSASDSTANTNNGTIVSTIATNGVIDGAGSFNGSSSYVYTPSAISLTNLTFSGWINGAVWVGGSHRMIISGNSQNTYMSIFNSKPFGKINNNNHFGVATLSTYTWYHVAMTFNDAADSFKLYLNGVQDLSEGDADSTISEQMVIGAYKINDLTLNFNGGIDEARIENTTRSSNWVWATYQNIASNTVFQSYGSVILSPLQYSLYRPNTTFRKNMAIRNKNGGK